MRKSQLYGLLGGFISSAALAVLYVTDKNYLLEGYEKLSWLIIWAACFIAVAQERSAKEDQFIGFYEALRPAFQTFVYAYVIKTIFIYLLFVYIDPDLLELSKQKAIEIFIEHKPAEEPQEIFNGRLEAYKKEYFGPRLFDLGIMLEVILGFVLSAITAFLMRRDRPDY
ncbi:DUF4199 domain-containing protein [Saprospira grandis]|uniref:DUF4199 domain-containing protein n=1 Tax=Saprospira grandis TaxID=1008 RepID=UPI0022DDE358|nr:DUF4199 domain-containing protein [Saprospira grandis]WBM75082.1 DUF4199 domain-containing protein [Saprospira grandis]